MTDAANRVLSLEEVLALPDGARVWVEDRCPAKWTGVRTYVLDQFGDGALRCGDGYVWRPDSKSFPIGSALRVWSLPQPPTQEELEKNPWEVGK